MKNRLSTFPLSQSKERSDSASSTLVARLTKQVILALAVCLGTSGCIDVEAAAKKAADDMEQKMGDRLDQMEASMDQKLAEAATLIASCEGGADSNQESLSEKVAQTILSIRASHGLGSVQCEPIVGEVLDDVLYDGTNLGSQWIEEVGVKDGLTLELDDAKTIMQYRYIDDQSGTMPKGMYFSFSRKADAPVGDNDPDPLDKTGVFVECEAEEGK